MQFHCRVLLSVLLWMPVGSLAWAGESDSASAEQGDVMQKAREAMRRGQAAFAAGNLRGALLEYKRAQELLPHANLPYFRAAEAEALLGEYEEAIRSYGKYLAINPSVSDAGEVHARLEELREKIAGTVTIRSTPEGSSVFLDGSAEPLGRTPIDRISVSRGGHTFLFRHDHYRDATVRAEVRGGQSAEVSAVLLEQTPMSSAKHGQATLGTGLALAGAGLLVTSAVLDLTWVRSRLNRFDSARNSGATDAADMAADAKTAQAVSLAGFIGAGVLLAAGATLYFWPEKKPSNTHVTILPGGVLAAGSF